MNRSSLKFGFIAKIKNYCSTSIKGDLLGGITSAFVALPTAMAFGLSSGLGVSAGLYGSIFAGFFAALLGGAVLQITGPTGPGAVIIASLVPNLSVSDVFTVVVLSGCIQILFGLSRLGKFIEYIPYPVISGFMTGVAALIVKEQLPSLMTDSRLFVVVFFIIVLCFLSAKYVPQIPAAMVPVILGITVSLIFKHNLPMIGGFAVGIPTLQFSIYSLFERIPQLLVPAFSLALLCSIDSLLTASILDSLQQGVSPHDSNRELIGQGMGNIMSGMFGGLSAAGATIRSIANVKAGARTRISGMIHSFVLLLLVLFAGGIGNYIPKVVLSGVILYIAITIVDYNNLKRIPATPIADVIVMLVTIVLTVITGLLQAIVVAFFLSSILFMIKMTQLEVQRVSLEGHFPVKERQKILPFSKKIVLFEIKGALFFGSSPQLVKELSQFTESKVVILKMYAVLVIDQTGLKVLEMLSVEANSSGVILLVSGVSEQIKKSLDRASITTLIGEDHFFPHPMEAIKRALEIVQG
ncbi:MAG: SulP family inorganic anion transporter [bacterium]